MLREDTAASDSFVDLIGLTNFGSSGREDFSLSSNLVNHTGNLTVSHGSNALIQGSMQSCIAKLLPPSNHHNSMLPSSYIGFWVQREC